MILREIKDRFLAIPWVYDTVRPILAGGIDFQLLTEFCRVGPSDRVFDLGCGTAQPLEFIRCSRYLGVDLDSAALQKAARFSSETVRFREGDDWDEACRELQPTVVLMIGVVHHISDEIFRSIAHRLRRAVGPMPPRLVTIDVTYFRRALLNNFLSRMDRGRNVRKPDAYERLYVGSGLQVLHSEVLPTRLRYVRYVGYHLSFRQGS
jgi:SAM-dependent methyltransferase